LKLWTPLSPLRLIDRHRVGAITTFRLAADDDRRANDAR
jgi:hypothetical protein